MRPVELDPNAPGGTRPVLDASRPTPDDGELFARSLIDPAAFADVFDRHWERVRAFCVSRAGADGEDIAADAFRAAFDHRADYDPRHADAGPWLFGIATNLLRRHFRSTSRGNHALRRLAGLVGMGEDRRTDEEMGRLEARALGPDLSAALAAIPAPDREALLLLAWGDLDYAEIATALQVPLGTVRSRIHRARRRLRLHLDERNHDDHQAQ